MKEKGLLCSDGEMIQSVERFGLMVRYSSS